MNNNIQYKGDVEITLMKGRKPYKVIKNHNGGTNELFRILCNALVGNSVASQIPKYINLYSDAEGTASVTLTRIHASKSEVNLSNSIYSTKYTFIIPGSYLVNGETVVGLKLFNKVENGSELASVTLDASQQFVTDTSSNVSITWTMTFSNAS